MATTEARQIIELEALVERLTAENAALKAQLTEVPAEGMPDSVRETLRVALKVLGNTRLVDLYADGVDKDVRGAPLDEALAYLDKEDKDA